MMAEPDSTFISTDTATSPPPPSQQRRRRTNVLFYAVVAISLTANVILVVVVTFHMLIKQRGHHHKSEGLSSMSNHQLGFADPLCLTCDQLGPLVESQDTIYDVIRLPLGHTLCCQKQRNDVTKLFHKIIGDEYYRRSTGREPVGLTRGMNEQIWSRPRESTWAHRYMVPHTDSPPAWTTSDPYNTSFCSNVECNGTDIVVSAGGLYLVYSHITFITSPAPSDTPFLHMIQRQNPNLPGLGVKPILLSKTSFRWTVAPQQTSFLSAIVKLRRQDRLHVKMSENYYDLVEKRMLSNFFGVMKV
ncbi:uncharacterized protein LOC124125200 [Haliotis rufescens]|uniref:uncharacterized protein LOC124125200 n=1 Tax=Haliotis rufescens TaxID=6454 RepID=UPI001EAFB4A1|nr:uncharacterized protein LOC124125200 [Haliotis rufescens]